MADRVFICYARDDQEFVLRLAANLKDRGAPLWVDQWDIPPGADWDKSIDDALYECTQFLIVLSPTAVESREVRGELRTALEESKPVLPVLYRKCRIPRQLRLYQRIDFTSREPDDSLALKQILSTLGITESAGPEIKEAQPRPRPKRATPRTSESVKAKPIEGKKAFTNTVGMTFVLIPSGIFMMGSPAEEPVRDDGEILHKVTITKPFYLQSTQVPQGQWKKVMGSNPSHFKKAGEDSPVDSVSWGDAEKFISKLNKTENTNKYRLPTEAEWEYACRAGTTTPFHTGDSISTDQANYDGRHVMPGFPKGKNRRRTVKVGSFAPNGWGVYDMHGNVWEWCQDWYGDYPKGKVKDPSGPSTGEKRVLRGGSWGDFVWNLRSAKRYCYYPDIPRLDIGLRIARDL